MLQLKKYPKRSTHWYMRGTIAGKEIFETTGTSDKARADAYRRQRERELYDQLALGKKPPVTFAEAAAAYIRAGGESKHLNRIVPRIGTKTLTELNQSEIDKVAAELHPDAKASTVNRQLINQVITVQRYATSTGMVDGLLPKLRRRKETKPVVSPADDDHLDRLLPHLSVGLRALIILMTFTGLRTGEALRVTAADIRDGYVLVPKTKNGDPRMVPIPDGWEYPPGGWGYQTTQGVGAALRRAHVSAELPYRDGHELGRHAFAARWLRSGGSMKGLQLAGGWRKFSIPADIYGHLEMTDVHEQMRQLSRRAAKGGVDTDPCINFGEQTKSS